MSIRLSKAASSASLGPYAQTLEIRDHRLIVDLGPDQGGTDAGPDPHDLYDAALAACKTLTVLWYARRKQIPLERIETVVDHDNSQERNGTYRLDAVLRLGGPLTDAQVHELESVAAKCPVHKLMTQVTTEITTRAERLT